jgi:hypothetical protein
MNNKEIIENITNVFHKRLLYMNKHASLYEKKRELMMCIERWYLNSKSNKKRVRDEEHDTDDE